ncbi:peptide/nickel transport system ATP-binding protein [Peptoclostridium litorale DSM 5388]|uniref:Oligopeptide transport ATP-binding protein AppF n=1 Tax=Peptoclostridium litorale DSM 5388 TaxID=1121324 RepID=A0A069RNX1_PEPLI|nr:dipeptide ABC transporter ATP-binding protein [Peptoclostridium litorale]KDR95877.1 oligopeptide transport ATP-binding protein AppF [Peptoclostridium litorale DSM 5388]SIO10850.1 peptide/nickel transport system ATP-binding protein [Peptoclostridium litorale DSM 5388]
MSFVEGNEALIRVEEIYKHFSASEGFFFKDEKKVKAVDGVSFDVKKGEALGIVGESGCGKSTLGRVLLRLLEADGGKVIFKGEDMLSLSDSEMRKRRKDMQIVFQDPFASLNPRMKVGELIAEPLKIHGVKDANEVNRRVLEITKLVGLNDYHLKKYPHEFSGGQRQRICIARALILRPEFVICDEAVSALDVSIQSQIINLLKDLKDELGLTYMFISHDLSVVRHISDRVGVMYLGKMVELAPAESLFENPRHPYTKALISAIPVPDPDVKKDRIILKGDVPNPMDIPKGCSFHTRCHYANDICKREEPGLEEGAGGHFTACHFSGNF